MKNYISIVGLLSIATLYSCRKVISVDLNSSAPRYTIVGNITDQPGPYHVRVTKSVNFNQDNNFPLVSGAQIYVTDVTTGIADTLSEMTAGDYVTHSLTGIPGHTYDLKVISGGDIFSATSFMPAQLIIDSLYTEKSFFGEHINLVPVYKDPSGKGNYYHLRLTVGDSTSPQIIIATDEFTDGQKNTMPIENKIKFLQGESLTVELECIDHNVFEYYNNLQQTIQQNSATPSNPQSNITGGALGYFSAHTVSKKTIIAP